jgi:hypothetical protein
MFPVPYFLEWIDLFIFPYLNGRVKIVYAKY